MLKAVVPDLASIINREVVVQQMIDEKAAEVEALCAEMAELNKELMLIQGRKSNQSVIVEDGNKTCRKRGR